MCIDTLDNHRRLLWLIELVTCTIVTQGKARLSRLVETQRERVLKRHETPLDSLSWTLTRAYKPLKAMRRLGSPRRIYKLLPRRMAPSA